MRCCALCVAEFEKEERAGHDQVRKGQVVERRPRSVQALFSVREFVSLVGPGMSLSDALDTVLWWLGVAAVFPTTQDGPVASTGSEAS